MPRRGNAARGDAKNIKRRRRALPSKRGFVLFCEGRNTEPQYFNAIRLAHTGGAAIQPVPVRGGDPVVVTKRAVAEKKKPRRQNTERSSDQVWVVFDREDHERFEEAVALCRSHDVCVPYSDPCFELWLILHIEKYDKACSNSDVQRRLETLRPEYNRKGAKTLDFTALMDRVEEAEERAAAQLLSREQQGTPFGNPSTTVGQLTRAIREASGSSPPVGKSARS